MKSKVSTNKRDLIIIGGGAGGLAAALTASEYRIKNITVLEARKAIGGNSQFAEGFFVLDKSRKTKDSIQEIKDELFEKTVDYTHHRSDPRLLRLLIDESENTINWLRSKGFTFEWRNISHNHDFPLYASDINAKTKTGAFIIKALNKECLDRGVTILCDTRAKKLITDDKGVVNGVLAESNGKSLKFSTKSVIIASGGFAGNKDLLKKYVPFYSDEIHLGGIPNQGDGLLMAAGAGADTDDIIACEAEAPAFTWTRKIPVNLTGHASSIWVNKNGERFTGEAFEPFLAANNLYRQPGKVSYCLMDKVIKTRIFREVAEEAKGSEASEYAVVENELDNLLKVHSAKGRIKIARTLDDIAEWIGVPGKKLKDTVKEYNAFCEKHHDDLFGKDPTHLIPLLHPPFYAICCYPNLLVTHGGIKINIKMEVLDKNQNPIVGLFAAGVDTGGIDTDTYNFGLPGHSFGFALSSGRIAGREAAKFVFEK